MRPIALCLFGLVACSNSASHDTTLATCERSTDCAVGEVCGAENLCVPFGHEQQNTCTGGVCCDGSGTCVDMYDDLCQADGCLCRIVHTGGATALADTLPRLVLTPGMSQEVVAVLSRTSGEPLPSGPFVLSVSETESLVVSGTQLAATQTAGVARINAHFGRNIRCEADVVNLGPAPQEGVRVTLIDAHTGLPVTGAHVVLDNDKDGSDDGASTVSNSDGVSVAQELTLPFDATIFAAGYTYVSVLDVQERDILIRLAPGAVVGGASGLLDLEDYEKTVLGGRSLPFVLGLAAPSFSPSRLWDFDLDLLFGGAAPSQSCDVMPSAGCYTFEIPGLFNDTIPTFGGLVLSLAHKPLKPFFEVSGEPGRRYVWGLGGEFTATDMANVFSDAVSYAVCSCDVSNACDAQCSCDAECGGSLAGRLVRTVLPLLPRVSAGLVGNVEMAPVDYASWVTHITEPYGASREDDARFPKLEGARALSAATPLTRFTDLALPELPYDAVTGGSMESVVVVSGVTTPDAGFVPLGLGAAFDCDADTCPGRLTTGGGVGSPYDGVLASQTLCASDESPCPASHVRTTPAGHAPLFVSRAPQSLAKAAWRTMVISLPLDSFNPEALRLSALVVAGEPGAAVDLAAQAFLPVPELPARQGRRLSLATGTPEAQVGRLQVSGAAPWTVVSHQSDASFVAPEVPYGFVDPFAAETVSASWVALASDVQSDWLLHAGRGLDDVFQTARGFATAKGVLAPAP